MALGFEGVTQRFGAVTALSDVSLTVRPGEIVALLGQSGCGKTTLLRLAAGVERPSAGRVLLEGRDVSDPARFVDGVVNVVNRDHPGAKQAGGIGPAKIMKPVVVGASQGGSKARVVVGIGKHPQSPRGK